MTLALVTSAAPFARADGSADPSRRIAETLAQSREMEHAPGRAFIEAGALLGANAIWYWLHTNMNVEDWDLGWDWESWSGKLFSLQHVRFDTNPFPVNAVTHPTAGLLYYQVGRANGFGVLGASALNLGAAVIWEYIAEFKEEISLNDLIINTSAGFGGSEAIVQVGRTFRRMRGPVGATLGLLLTPFETAHELFDGRRQPRLPVPWHRFRLWAGGGSTRFTGAAPFVEEVAGLDLQVVAHDDYGDLGQVSGWTSPGAWSRVRVGMAFGRDEPGWALPGLRIATETTLAGHYAQEIGDDGRGRGLFFGLGSGFIYETRRLDFDQDRLLVCELAGPRLAATWFLGPAALRLDLAAYADFAMVQAHVFGPTPPFDPNPPFTTPLRRFGYYYAYGASLDGRLVLEVPRAQLEVGVLGHLFGSLDGRDRIEMDGVAEDPHGISDQRLFGHLELTGFPWGGDVGLGARFEAALRRGAWQEEERTTSELRGTLHGVLRF